jgi:transcriptional regulator with XRE-family HTH domain
MSFCERVKSIRVALGKSQKEMALLVGVGLRTWQQYEEGVHDPSWKVISKLSEVGFNADWLASGKGHIVRKEIDYTIAKDIEAGSILDENEFPEGFTSETLVDITIPIEELKSILLRDVIEIYLSKRPESSPTRASRDIVLIYRHFSDNFNPEIRIVEDKVKINEYIDEWF